MNQYKQIKTKQLSKKRSISVSRATNTNISSIKKSIENKKNKLFSNFNIFKNKSPIKNKTKNNSRNNSANIHKKSNSFFKLKSKTIELENLNDNKIKIDKNIKTILQNAKELINAQTKMLKEFSELTKAVSKSELELESKLNENENKNFNNLDNIIEEFIQNQSNKKCINCLEKDKFFMEKLNELNGFIGELGYNYVFHKFKSFNYNNENICIYFENTKNLICLLHKQFCEMKYMIKQQEEEIKNYNLKIANLQKQFSEFQENISNNSSQMYKTNNAIILENSISPNQSNLNYESNNIFEYSEHSYNEKQIPINIEQNEKNGHSNFNFNFKEIERNKNMKSSFNENKNHNNISQSSNLFDSETFFEGYKRNKEIRLDLELEHHYTEENENKNNKLNINNIPFNYN